MKPRKLKKQSGSYPNLAGNVTDPSAMDVHNIPDATNPYSGGVFAPPGQMKAGMTGGNTVGMSGDGLNAI